MNLLELQDKLSESITDISDTKNMTPDKAEAVFKRAEYIAKVSKQMINNADIILRADKLCNRHDRIDVLAGERC